LESHRIKGATDVINVLLVFEIFRPETPTALMFSIIFMNGGFNRKV